MSSNPNDGPQIPPPIGEQGVDETNSEARNWAMFTHLAALAGYILPAAGNIVGPLIVWLLKKDQFPFVNDHGKEALNFQISITIYLLVATASICIGIGIVLIPAVAIFELVFMIIAAITAAGGKRYRYPLTIRLIK